jgi:hypothetical protein
MLSAAVGALVVAEEHHRGNIDAAVSQQGRQAWPMRRMSQIIFAKLGADSRVEVAKVVERADRLAGTAS